MYYYVYCPVCKHDLSNFVDPEDPRVDTITCVQCKTPLRLQHGTQWDDDLGGEIKLFWFEKENVD